MGPCCCHLCISDITKGRTVVETPILPPHPPPASQLFVWPTCWNYTPTEVECMRRLGFLHAATLLQQIRCKLRRSLPGIRSAGDVLQKGQNIRYRLMGRFLNLICPSGKEARENGKTSCWLDKPFSPSRSGSAAMIFTWRNYMEGSRTGRRTEIWMLSAAIWSSFLHLVLQVL